MAVVTAKRAAVGPAGPRPWRVDVTAFHRMMEVGLFGGARVELLNGQIYERAPVNPPHAKVIRRLSVWGYAKIDGPEWVVQAQVPVTLPPAHEPLPDFVIASGPDQKYDDRHPGPSEIGLLIEVADSSLTEDRRDKGAVYAASKVGVYWIINIPENIVEVYTRPRGGRTPRYLTRTDFARGSEVPVILGGVEVTRLAVDDILPPAPEQGA